MYYLFYIPLYLFSLIPLRVLYLFSDFLYFISYTVLGYRKKVVLDNLRIAFPEKTDQQRLQIASAFYHNLADTLFETIKFISWSRDTFEKHFSCDLSGMDQAYASGKSIYLVGMHNFNWEYVNWGLALKMKYPLVCIYMPLANKSLDKIIFDMRSRCGSLLIPATDFRNSYAPYRSTRHILGTVADQSPGNPANAYWIEFFGKPTAFTKGTEKGARMQDAAVVFVHFYKIKRGSYRVETLFHTDQPKSLEEGTITRSYAAYIEKCLREHPDNYLWSHRRWKHEWKEGYDKIMPGA